MTRTVIARKPQARETSCIYGIRLPSTKSWLVAYPCVHVLQLLAIAPPSLPSLPSFASSIYPNISKVEGAQVAGAHPAQHKQQRTTDDPDDGDANDELLYLLLRLGGYTPLFLHIITSTY